MKTLFWIALVCVAGAWPCAAAQPAHKVQPSVEDQFKAAFETMVKADEARDKGDIGEAMRLYKGALDSYRQLNKKYPDLQPGVTKYRIAYCSSQIDALMKRADGAGSVAEREDTAPPPPPAGSPENKKQIPIEEIKSTVKLLLKSGETAKARSLLLDALRADPDDTTVRLLIGIAQCQAGQFHDAALTLKQLSDETSSNANVCAALGAAYFGLGRTSDAAAEIKKAIRLNPGSSEAHYNMAQILLAGTPPDINAASYHYKKYLDFGGKPDKDIERRLQ